MRRIKVSSLLFPACALLLLLSGCEMRGLVFENYRDLEQLRVVSALGIDEEEGLIRLSISTGSGIGDEDGPLLKTASGGGITGAMTALAQASSGEDLLYSHVQHIILGESAAQNALPQILDYIERSPEMRADTPLFVVKGGTAEALVTGTGGKSYDLSAVLSALEREAENSGRCRIFSCRDLARRLARSGSGLLCALEAKELDKLSRNAEEEKPLTAEAAGYCVIRKTASAGFLSEGTAWAVSLLTNRAGNLPVALPDGAGGTTTVRLIGSRCELRPVWREDGTPEFDVLLRVSAAITETSRPETMLDSGSPEALESRLEDTLSAWIRETLRASGRMEADFLSLGVALERSDPRAFYALGPTWPGLLAQTPFSVQVEADVEKSYDLAQPMTLS